LNVNPELNGLGFLFLEFSIF